ncbi:MAG TPA: preprotein translocase subunit YajC [Fermentimonas caenicola]|jgi:preprotein translocase subunit YajC|uniref:Sec translocon accessory complex subunit YajC n=1 Tax=Fermentimonas caenicola TaxID=1562970 RepID=A0A098C2V6_9BACT|nr:MULTISPECIES: preprotein translocase subunit YajC [Lascolabacillus]MBP6176463.1 preprotein translocase subunit YajC [Fermentimonas sp.]MDI9625895.1 preprotein translocase subunit YajC [Bacteroidota bacterium]TAH62246.1 MAG: preprotein translocase subunit YajC [Fermentimonas caenicola]MBP7105285.1 preprotein translocase subunit YajC [Fermentimonas sp.]MCK9500436.1 preprotein translocase subunit YajC [Lascolabacillus sp.]
MNILLQATAQGPAGGMGGTLIMLIAIIAVFYFFMIRPQQKKQKELQKSREAMTTGDKVVTAGGIHGRIKEVGDTWFLVEIADGVRIKIEKTSVFQTTKDIAAQ